jgi:alpha-ribazole phosphatase
MRFLLVTHGQTDWTVARRYQGHTDIPLNDEGRRQALRLQRHLAGESIQAVFASDLRRAHEMAETVAAPHALLVRNDRRLREMHFGDWEGLTFAEVEQRDAKGLAAWRANPLEVRPPGGELLTELAARLEDFLDGFAEHAADSKVLLVGHRGSLSTLLCSLMGVPVEKHWEFGLKLASLSEVEIGRQPPELLRLNETLGDS